MRAAVYTCLVKTTKALSSAYEAVAKACAAIEQSAKEPALGLLAKHAGMSPSHFHRTFKELTGLTPKAYALARRARRMRKELPRHSSITTAMYEAGFSSAGRFYESSSKALGMKPSAYRGGGKGEVIRFAVGRCSLGSVLVAATDKGICAVTLHEDPEVLLRDLQDKFPRAGLIGADASFESHVATVVGLVEHPYKKFDLPLDVRGTAFQERVWKALRRIPAGSTASYADIARDIGMPKGVRAVAQACGANKIAVVIPCHRVIRTDGSLSGYRWGVERKAELLRREAQ